jgi:hypothetical protein
MNHLADWFGGWVAPNEEGVLAVAPGLSEAYRTRSRDEGRTYEKYFPEAGKYFSPERQGVPAGASTPGPPREGNGAERRESAPSLVGRAT